MLPHMGAHSGSFRVFSVGLEHHVNGGVSQESDWKGYWKDIEQDGKSLKILSLEICLCPGDASGLLHNEIYGQFLFQSLLRPW